MIKLTDEKKLLLFILIGFSYTIIGEQLLDGKLHIVDKSETGKCNITVQEGDLVTWKSYGFNRSGKIFDVSEYEIKIGNQEAPKGVDQGLRGLCIGDERTLILHPDVAWGAKGLDSRLPGNATISYGIQILKLNRTDQVRKGITMYQNLSTIDTKIVKDCGMRVQKGDLAKWYFNATLTNGDLFDSGYRNINIDEDETLQGVNDGVKGMCVDGRRTIIMHNILAYGSDRTEKIPPYSNLIYHVHLVKIDRGGAAWEDLEVRQRTAAGVTKIRPIKIQAPHKVGKCDIKVKRGDTITWTGVGYLLDGTIFDDFKVQITIGDGKTIRSLERALIGLCANDSRSITIHPDKAFGTKGVPGRVPMSATVIFDFTVLSISKSEL